MNFFFGIPQIDYLLLKWPLFIKVNKISSISKDVIKRMELEISSPSCEIEQSATTPYFHHFNSFIINYPMPERPPPARIFNKGYQIGILSGCLDWEGETKQMFKNRQYK